jgi:predicted Mrr-cat superfamily restriction endonuclease
MVKQAFIIRCAPSYVSRINEVLKNEQIVIGWSDTRDLLFDNTLDRDGFKEILMKQYPSYMGNPYSLGQGTGYLWRFIKEMRIGDYAIVPILKAFYIGEITSDLIFLPEKINEDTAIRRNVKWLNNGHPILRDYCSSGLVSRLKYQGTCVSASDLIEDIEKAIDNSHSDTIPNFRNQLNEKLKQEASILLNSDSSFLDDRKFEDLVRKLMIGLGAKTSIIPPKTRYKDSIADVDVLADFIHLGLKIYVQVKKHKLESDEHAVKQLIEAMKIDNPDGSQPIFGWVVTSAKFNENAEKLANNNSIRIVNGEDLVEMLIAVGLEVLTDD